jgi:hypothetical protein
VNKVILSEKLARFSEHWRPKIGGELNDQQVEHRPIADTEASVPLFEPAGTLKTAM